VQIFNTPRKMVWSSVITALLFVAVSANARELHVCADPHNLPFSNQQGKGLENRIAALLASKLGAGLEYTWSQQRHGYARNTVNTGRCDLWPGVAAGIDTMATTRPYYTSTYVFVTRADRKLNIQSLNDPRLHRLIIAVQMVGDDETNTPPAHALARRGIVSNVHGYMLYGDFNRPATRHGIIDAVANGKVDVALVWGPIAGYYAAREPVRLILNPVKPAEDGGARMTFSIAVGVRRGDTHLKKQVDQILDDNRETINSILAEYHVPLVNDASPVIAQSP
jgi:mxaJ protein